LVLKNEKRKVRQRLNQRKTFSTNAKAIKPLLVLAAALIAGVRCERLSRDIEFQQTYRTAIHL
jgi:hypothetical protein